MVGLPKLTPYATISEIPEDECDKTTAQQRNVLRRSVPLNMSEKDEAVANSFSRSMPLFISRNSSSKSAGLALKEDPRRIVSARWASSDLPLTSSHLGDSGIKNIRILKPRGMAKRLAKGIW
jgi:hypothetical protein